MELRTTLPTVPASQWHVEFPGGITLVDADGNSFPASQYADADANTFVANKQYVDGDDNTFTAF